MPSNTTWRLDTVSWSASPHQKNPSTPRVMEDTDALFIATELFTPAPVSSVASVYYNMAGSSPIIISSCRTRTTHNPVPCVLNQTRRWHTHGADNRTWTGTPCLEGRYAANYIISAYKVANTWILNGDLVDGLVLLHLPLATNGANDGTRTHNTMIKSHVPYQFGYIRIWWAIQESNPAHSAYEAPVLTYWTNGP